MAVYRVLNPHSPLTAVEFSPVSEGNFTCFTVDSPVKKEAVKRWLVSEGMGQEVIAETLLDGRPVLVTHGNKSQDDIMNIMEEHGDKLEFHHHPRGFSDLAWPLRSALGITGQVLQLTSSLSRGTHDWPLFLFASSNLVANGINLLFGAQRDEDRHRLRFLKGQVNDVASEYLAAGSKLPDINAQRSNLHHEPEESKTITEHLHHFIEKHSVRVGELGLRYLGAFVLASDKKSSKRRLAGWGSITGKTTALMSKVPDPYNPKPHTLVDSIRENFTFRTGGLIEAASFATLSYDAFTSKTQKLHFRGREYRDYLSGIGAGLFTLGYITRTWAPFGVKETNMEELYAHISDSLAKVQPDKLPQLMADTAAFVTNHFKDKHLDFGQVFTQLTIDLYRYHHIALEDKQKEARKPVAAAPSTPESRIQDRIPKAKTPDEPMAGHIERVLASSASQVEAQR